MAQSKLEQIAITQRNTLIPINDYNNEAAPNNYTANHSKALTDEQTPEHGRGTHNFLDTPNYNAGTQTDINGNPSIPGSGRNSAIANNGSTWGYTPETTYQAPNTDLNQGQIVIE